MSKSKCSRKMISIVVITIAVSLVLSLSDSVSALRRIDNRVDIDALVIPSGGIGVSSSSSGNHAFEKGDAIYRQFEVSALMKLRPRDAVLLFLWSRVGHAGLYWYWEPDIENDQTIKENHKTIESNLARPHPWYNPLKGAGVHNNYDFQYFVDSGQCWGVRTSERLDADKRLEIIETARSQLGCKYHFFGGYKRPGVSFRCDGLVEYCYEIALGDKWKPGKNGGIVKNDFWRPRRGCRVLYPRRQFNSLSAQKNAFFPMLVFGRLEGEIMQGPIEIGGEEIKPEDGKYKVYGDEVRVNIHACDIDWDSDGSGITRVQLWVGEPDDTPEEMPGFRIEGAEDDKDYPVDHDYVYTWDTTKTKDGEPLFPNGDYTLKTIAFDQAGNKAEAELQVEVANGEEKYLCVRAEPVFLADSGGTCKITVELWDYGECPEEGCSPEGCVLKKEGTQSWDYGNVEEKYMLEKCCEEFETEPAPCDDEEFSAVVELSPRHILGESAGLHRDDDWDGTMEITYKGGKVCGSIGGIGYRDIDGNLLPSDNRRTVLISARCNVAKGAGILMINPIILKPSECDSAKILSSRRFVSTLFGSCSWEEAWEQTLPLWNAASYGSWGYFSDKVIGPGGQLLYCETAADMLPPHVIVRGYKVSALKMKIPYHAIHPDTGEILTDVVSAIVIAKFDGIYTGGGANVYYTPDAPGVSDDDELHPIIKCVTTGVSVTVTNEWDAEHGQYEFGDVKSIFDGSEFPELEFHPDDSIVPDFQPFGTHLPWSDIPYWNKSHRIKFKLGGPHYPWIVVVPKAEE